MFFEVILEGISVLTYWRFWAIVLGGGLVSILPFIIAAIAAIPLRGPGEALGCLLAPLMMLWSPLVLTATVILLAPLLVVRTDEIPFEFLSMFSWWDIAKIAGIGFAAYFVVGIIPIIGSIGTLPLFAQAATILGVLMTNLTDGRMMVWPGFLMGLGLALVGSIIAVLAFYLLVAPIVALTRNEGAGSMLAMPIALVPATVPLTLYAGWLRVANGL
jgi:hypothetical protein